MNDMLPHASHYLNSAYRHFSTLVPDSEWGDWKAAARFMDRFGMPEAEYAQLWQPIQEQIFTMVPGSDCFAFPGDFFVIPERGGCLFDQALFEKMRQCMVHAKDSRFAIIQTGNDYTAEDPTFRLRFDANATWDDMISGQYLSAILLEMPYNAYVVFGDSGCWGIHVMSDRSHPVILVGVKPEHADAFGYHLWQSREEADEIWAHVPECHRAQVLGPFRAST